MISFESDYTTGAHPRILERLAQTNLESMCGYGMDPYCDRAGEKIRAACGCPGAQIAFLTGGTQANVVVLSSMLRDHEGVLAASSGHINVHEAGALEFTGHKVLALPQQEGKIQAAGLAGYLKDFYADDNHEHMVFPGILYLSWPTEFGTLYSRAELAQIAEICRAYGIPLFVDGARLGYGLASPACDLTLPQLAGLCDVFTIGGTKVGALCGEAVVFTKENQPPHFMTSIKKRGALLAKGRLLGIQFDTLFTDDLYMEISRHAIRMAQEMKDILRETGCVFWLESPTNQQFIVLDNAQMERLSREVIFSFWEKADARHSIIRLSTSWSTTGEDLRQLRCALHNSLRQEG